MQEFHQDINTYFDMQYRTAAEFIIPYIQQYYAIKPGARVLEIGCGEAGVLKAFHQLGADCTGIELEAHRIERAKKLLDTEVSTGRMHFIVKNIYDIDPEKDGLEKFDLIILKDVIEHIPQQENIIPELKKLCRPGAYLFFAFPPWYMPFGGHQQILKNKKLSKIPWTHLLPEYLYKKYLKSSGDSESLINELLELKETGISIERFQKLAAKDYQIIDKTLFLLNPIYKFKFGWNPLKTPALLRNIPFFRNFYSTCAYFLLRNSQ